MLAYETHDLYVYLLDRPQDLKKAGELLRAGGLVAIPTETVYGLAANALDGAAVKAIYQAKGRPSDNPLIVHICDFGQLSPLVREVPEAAKQLAQAFWPGPLTIILKKSDLVPAETSGGLDTVAVRFPAHPVAQAVIREAGVPLAAPSANLSGRPSPTTFAHVEEDLTGRVDALVDGGDCAVGVESTVITLAEGVPKVLRPGGVTVAQLREVLGRVEVDPAVLHKLEEGKRAASPGMKYKHYAPQAQVYLVDASPEDYETYVNQQGDGTALCFDEDAPHLIVPFVSYGGRYDGAKQAHLLFSALHYLDQVGAKKAYARMPAKRGVGLAVYNRLIRAAAFRVLRPRPCLTVGLVGPSGAGKSTVAKLLAQGGCAVIDCDALTGTPPSTMRAALKSCRPPSARRWCGKASWTGSSWPSGPSPAPAGKSGSRPSPSPAFWPGCRSCGPRRNPRAAWRWCWTPPPSSRRGWTAPAPASWPSQLRRSCGWPAS